MKKYIICAVSAGLILYALFKTKSKSYNKHDLLYRLPSNVKTKLLTLSHHIPYEEIDSLPYPILFCDNQKKILINNKEEYLNQIINKKYYNVQNYIETNNILSVTVKNGIIINVSQDKTRYDLLTLRMNKFICNILSYIPEAKCNSIIDLLIDKNNIYVTGIQLYIS